MLWTAISIGCVIVPTVDIIKHGGFTPQTSIIGFSARAVLVAASIANLTQKWRLGEISWQPRKR